MIKQDSKKSKLKFNCFCIPTKRSKESQEQAPTEQQHADPPVKNQEKEQKIKSDFENQPNELNPRNQVNNPSNEEQDPKEIPGMKQNQPQSHECPKSQIIINQQNVNMNQKSTDSSNNIINFSQVQNDSQEQKDQSVQKTYILEESRSYSVAEGPIKTESDNDTCYRFS